MDDDDEEFELPRSHSTKMKIDDSKLLELNNCYGLLEYNEDQDMDLYDKEDLQSKKSTNQKNNTTKNIGVAVERQARRKTSANAADT